MIPQTNRTGGGKYFYDVCFVTKIVKIIFLNSTNNLDAFSTLFLASDFKNLLLVEFRKVIM